MDENKMMLDYAMFQLGVKVGIQMMEDKIQRNCELGRPVKANGDLYFFQDSREHLFDIMDSLEE